MNGRIKINQPQKEDIIEPQKKQALSKAGSIKTGTKAISQNGHEYPVSTDHFVASSKFKFDAFVRAKYGDKPTELPILFYSDDFNDCCSERLEIRDKAGRLFAFGDGETFGIYSEKTKDFIRITTEKRPNIMDEVRAHLHESATNEQAKNIKWVQALTLRFIIKDIPVIGYWELTTKGLKTSIPNLRDRFDQCLELFGTVRWFPFLLTATKVKSNKPGDSRQYPIIDLVPALSIETGLKIAAHIQESGNFNQAKLALIDLNNLNNEGNNKLLL
ncbi:recombination directionality factor [Runella zeae]|uniref:recombination directionality factor n=1 Tax=Runella zeae TaxID=94255 RepID=UPI0003F6D26B|nr:hypothetical protein [Runella zeae]